MGTEAEWLMGVPKSVVIAPPAATRSASVAHVSHRLVPRLNNVTSASPRRRWRILLPHPPAITVRVVRVGIAALDVSPDGGLLPASMRPLDGVEGGSKGSKGFRG